MRAVYRVVGVGLVFFLGHWFRQWAEVQSWNAPAKRVMM